MIRAISTLVFFLGITAAASAQQAINLNGQMIPLHCKDWKQNPDGSWTQTATIVARGMTMRGNTFKNTAETRMLDKKCK
ncbi:hypothetical protein [Methylovirgula sp. HY1]|uniref:hypothetical protein n=1 Tax=Methylovirgula sp. HY1 TaxID=2822761 RepID=UPI001C5A6D41|nr:hypothetical protein [Methylovirgula sp. HY1]QXX73960.1 hypothetical protein MHY1_00761 [Methylovirgula sp. HY1]